MSKENRPLSLTAVLVRLHTELLEYCRKNSDRAPSYDWAVTHAVSVLQQYPSGVSRCVLQTELEHRWRTALRRGENAGRLKKTLSTKQLALTDVLVGKLGKVDGLLRYRLCEADGSSVEMILHQQSEDWIKFCQHNGIEPFLDRSVHLTQCRLLWSHPPILLPTAMICPTMDLTPAAPQQPQPQPQPQPQQTRDSMLYAQVARPSYATFYADASCGNVPGVLHRQQNGNEALFVFATVLDIGTVTARDTPDGGSCHHRIVRLRLWPLSTTALGDSLQCKLPQSTCSVIFIILFADDTSLADLWKPGDALFFFRPFLSRNQDETLFGTRVDCSDPNARGAFSHAQVDRADEMLINALVDPQVVPVHMLVSPRVTVCGFVRGLAAVAAGAGEGTLFSQPELQSLSSPTPNGLRLPPPLAPWSVHLTGAVPNGTFTLFARLISCTFSGSDADSSFLWMLPDGDGPRGLLVRVKCANALLRSSPNLSKACHLQPGQVYFLEGLSKDRAVNDGGNVGAGGGAVEGAAEQIPFASLPAWALSARIIHLTLGAFVKGASAIKATSLTLTSPSAALSEHRSSSNNSGSGSGNVKPSLVNVSQLAALVCSPSVVSPVRLSQCEDAWSQSGFIVAFARAIKLCPGCRQGTIALHVADCGGEIEVDGAGEGGASSFEALVETDAGTINLTQSLPSVNDAFDLGAAQAYASKWAGKVYVLLLSRIDDLVGLGVESGAGRVGPLFRLNVVADHFPPPPPPLSYSRALPEEQQQQALKKARNE